MAYFGGIFFANMGGRVVRIIFNQARSHQELSGDPNPQHFLRSTAVQMEGVLPCKWEAYRSTNWRCSGGFPFLQGLEDRKVQRYKWGVYCRSN